MNVADVQLFVSSALGGAKVGETVEIDGNIITGNGPASTIKFAAKIIENTLGKETADSVLKGMMIENA